MSVVSSILSTRSTGWKIDVRLASLMDSVFAIGFGLGLRFVIDTVSDHDFKVTGTLVGLWEGVIMLHFTKKMPKSSDPFIAYGVRLFVDFLYTESVTRLVIVLVWTALGMVLADVTPGIWYEVGLRRVWRRFRRDIYTMLRMIPTVAFFPPTRTVRFSPSREPSTIVEGDANADADADTVPPSSVVMTEQTPTTNTIPTTTAPAAREILRRRVPGYFPADFSDTETEPGSVRLVPSPGERTSRRLSVYPGVHDFDQSVSSQNDLDEENLSSSISSASTERPGASSTVIDASTIPDMYAEEPLVDVAAAPVKDEEEMKTPKQSSAPYMPPTPSDSAMHLFRRQPSEDPLLVRPPSEFMPQIPDFLDEVNTEDWEKIQRQEATEEKPPTPPAKDPAYKLNAPIIPVPVPPQPQLQRSTPSPEDESKGWDMLDSQFISNPNDSNINATFNDYQVQTYDGDDDDDMYGDVAPEYSTFPAMGESSTTEPPPVHTTDFTSGILGPDTVRTNPWAGVEEAERQQREEAARKQREEEEELKRKQEEEAAEAKRLEEEEKLKEKKKAQEKAERAKKEADDAAIRKKKQEEAEAAERKRKEEEEEAAAAEQKRNQEEAEEQKRKEEEREREEEQKKKEDEKRRKAEEKQRREEEKQRKKDEAEQKKREEAERMKHEEEEKATAKAKKLAEDAEAKRLKEEAAAEKKRLEEEADALAAAAALAQALAEEAERKKEEEAEAKRLKEEQEAATVMAEEDARLMMEEEKQIKEQEADQRREAEERERSEVTQAEPIPPSESRPPNNAEQDPEKDLPPQPLESQTDGESTASEASGAPSNEPSERLDRMLLLRAQMVQVEGRLNDLRSPDSDQEIKQTEKILRKMRRQAERRYAAGVFISLTR